VQYIEIVTMQIGIPIWKLKEYIFFVHGSTLFIFHF